MKADHLDLTATVAETVDLTPNIRMIRFAVPQGLLNLEAGAHVTFDIPKGDGKMTRSYSVVDDGKYPEMLSIAVKLEPASKGGSRYMWSLRAGDEIHVSANGNAMPPTFSASDYILLAGGIGVTPMTGMARTLIRTGKTVRMIYCVRTSDEAAFAEVLDQVLGEGLELLCDSAGQKLDLLRLLDSIGPQTVLFMCGPQGLMESVRTGWQERGLPVQNLRYETFANSGNFPTRAFQVTVAETGRKLRIGADENLLDVLIASGHDVLFDCRRGECGLCKLQATEPCTNIDHRDVFLSPSERARNDCLCACVSRLSGGHITVHIDGIQHGRSG